MKKFLALVLALVMTMSLVTVSASAKTDFTDDAKITNEEAVEVLNAIGVLTGYADGSFRPQATLTRGAGAKIIAYLMLGQTKADKLAATYTVFKDVDDTVGLAAYIEWAAANGIVDGYGDGNFGPYNTLTEYAFGKMLLTALGYSSEKEGFTGAGWQKNVYRIATSVGVFDGSEAFGACNRETAARMALGALTAYTVKYGYVTVWDKDIVNAVFTTNGAVPVDYMYKNYPGLGYNSEADIWGRPGHTWTYKTWSKFYMDEAVKTYYTTVDDCALLVDLGIAVSSKAKLTLSKTWYNGVNMATTALELQHKATHADCNDYFFGGQGVLTQVFADPDNAGKYIVTEIASYLAQVTSVTKTHAGKSTDLKVFYRNLSQDPFGRKGAGNQLVTSVDETVIENATLLTDAYAVDDILLVTWNASQANNGIIDHALATGVAGKLSGFKTDANAYPAASQTFVDGAQKFDAFGFTVDYDASKTFANVGTNYAFYYDAYGNVIGMFKIEDAAAQYGVVDAIWAHDTDKGVHNIYADFVTMDAVTAPAVNVAYLNDVKAANVPEGAGYGWIDENKANNAPYYTYYLHTFSVDANGNYTINNVTEDLNATNVEHHKANQIISTSKGNLFLTEKTQILVRDTAGEYKSYVGYANLPLLHATQIEAMYDANGYAKVVFINNAMYDGSTVTGYVTNVDNNAVFQHTDGVTYYAFDLYVDGKVTPAYVSAANEAILDAEGLYTMTFKAVDGIVVVDTVKKLVEADHYFTNCEIKVLADGLVRFNEDTYSYVTAGVAVYLIDDHGNLTEGALTDLAVGQKVNVQCVKHLDTLKAIYLHVAD